MSRILCIIDGMTDLEFRAEAYPHLSSMTVSHTMDTCWGREPESLGCILRLLGVDPVPELLRGYAEALGEGIPVEKEDLILRGSWFALDGEGRCTVPVPGPRTLPPGASHRYYHLEQYKSLLVFPGLAQAVRQIQTWPPFLCAGQRAEELYPRGSEILRGAWESWRRPDRCLIPWGQSVPASLPPFPEKAAVICGTSIVRGIARLLDMELIPVPAATGDVDTDLGAKTEAALTAAQAYPFVLLHINGGDEASHRKNRQEKEAFLGRVDAAVLPPLLASEHDLTVMADHGTDPETGQHLDIPQPVFRKCGMRNSEC